MSKFFEVIVQTTTVYVVEVRDDEDSDVATDVVGDKHRGEWDTMDCYELRPDQVESYRRHADEVILLEDE